VGCYGNHGNSAETACCSYLLGGSNPIHYGQSEIHEDDVGAFVFRDFEGPPTVFGFQNQVTEAL
jgi:hypothetical protein